MQKENGQGKTYYCTAVMRSLKSESPRDVLQSVGTKFATAPRLVSDALLRYSYFSFSTLLKFVPCVKGVKGISILLKMGSICIAFFELVVHWRNLPSNDTRFFKQRCVHVHVPSDGRLRIRHFLAAAS